MAKNALRQRMPCGIVVELEVTDKNVHEYQVIFQRKVERHLNKCTACHKQLDLEANYEQDLKDDLRADGLDYLYKGGAK